MEGKIFMEQGDEGLVPMNEKIFEDEDKIQEYVADYPNLLPGDQIDPANPRRWLLIKREMGVPDKEGGSGRWAMDHLLLDQDAIPTFVEAKRSSNTEVRRKVVAQILDYAANAVVYWSADEIRATYESNCQRKGTPTSKGILDLLDKQDPGIVEEYWQQVRTNLQAEKIRLIIVADEIPPETRRIVEFLNGQMKSAEMIAVEIKRYAGTNNNVLVSRVIGATTRADIAKGKPATEKKAWDEDSFYQAIEQTTPNGAHLAKSIQEWAEERKLEVHFTGGYELGKLNVSCRHEDQNVALFYVETNSTRDFVARIYVQVGNMRDTHQLKDGIQLRQLLESINTIPDINIDLSTITDEKSRFPSFLIPALFKENAMNLFLKGFDVIVNEIRNS